MKNTQDIFIRDPYIVTDRDKGLYYMFGSTDPNVWQGRCEGFDYYTSRNLREWDGPFPAFKPEESFWSHENFWAPEVHFYQGRWHMFASFKAPGVARGTQILVSDAPDKPFTPWSDGPVTPSADECLDGTLFVDEQGKPWMVYCHEWTQIKNGTMCAIELSQDLRTALGKPVLLFDAASCSQVKRNPEENYVTDGPCLRRNRKGELLMLWSSYGQQGYFVATARAPGGQVTGPWVHDPELLVSHDAGHPMLFESLDGQLMMALHQNSAQHHDYALFYPVEEDGKGKIRLKGKAL